MLLKMMGSNRCHERVVPHALHRGDLHVRHPDLANSCSAKVSFKRHCWDVWLLKVPFSCLMFLTLACSPIPTFRKRKICHGKREMITAFTKSVYSLQNDESFLLQKPSEFFKCPAEPAEPVNGIGGPSPPCYKQLNNKGDKESSIKEVRKLDWANWMNMEYMLNCWNACAWSSRVLSSVEWSYRHFWGRLPWPTYSNLHRISKWRRSYPWLPFLQRLGTPEGSWSWEIG